MTVQQCNCYETTTLPTWETNEAELSESDKQENAAEDRSDNSLLLFLLSSFVKEKSTQMVSFFYGAKFGFLTRKSGRAEGVYSILVSV